MTLDALLRFFGAMITERCAVRRTAMCPPYPDWTPTPPYPTRLPLNCCAVVSAGRLGGKSRFSWLFETGLPRLSIPPFASEFSNLGMAHEQQKNETANFTISLIWVYFRFDFLNNARRTPVQKEDAEAEAHAHGENEISTPPLISPRRPSQPSAAGQAPSCSVPLSPLTTAGCELRGAVEHTNNRASGVRDRTTTRPPFATVRC